MPEENDTKPPAKEPGGQNDDPKDGETDPKEKTFSQDEVSRIGTREKREGKSAGQREILETLGVKDVDEAKEILEAHRKREQESLSEAEKARREAEKEKEEATKERVAARQERHESRIERFLISAGVDVKASGKAVKLVDLEVTDGLEDEDYQAAVEALKKDMPTLFSSTKNQGNPGSDPGKGPGGDGGSASSQERAKEVLARRHPKPQETTTT